MATNKRDRIKHVRDKAKSAYKKADFCYICGSSDTLELHHFYSLTNLLDKWAKEHNYDISTDELVIQVRDKFIEEHYVQIYEKVVTLCKKHHQLLHQIYGGKPLLHTAEKQAQWVEKQKEKYGNKAMDT